MFTPSHQMVLCAPFALQLFFSAPNTHTIFTNFACASPSVSMYLLVVVRLACPAKAWTSAIIHV